jgi:hypothetical protein
MFFVRTMILAVMVLDNDMVSFLVYALIGFIHYSCLLAGWTYGFCLLAGCSEGWMGERLNGQLGVGVGH